MNPSGRLTSRPGTARGSLDRTAGSALSSFPLFLKFAWHAPCIQVVGTQNRHLFPEPTGWGGANEEERSRPACSKRSRRNGTMTMKMLFFSSERAEVESVRNELLAAGVACEIRETVATTSPISGDTELWIQDDADAHRAAMLCVQRGVGFARRAATSSPGLDREQERDSECNSH